MIQRLFNWLRRRETPSEDCYVLVRIPSGILLWFTEGEHTVLCRPDTCLLWKNDGEIKIIEERWLHHYSMDTIFLVTNQVEEVRRSHLPRAEDDGWPYSSMWLYQRQQTYFDQEWNTFAFQQTQTAIRLSIMTQNAAQGQITRTSDFTRPCYLSWQKYGF